MRRLLTTLLSVLALAAVMYSPASAQIQARGTVALWWTGCDNSANKALDLTLSSPATATMVLSIFERVEILQGYNIKVFWGVPSPGVVPDAWRFDSDGCNADLGTISVTAVNATTCPRAQGPRPLMIYQFFPNYVQVGNAFDPFTCDPAVHYTLYKIVLDFATNGCAGYDTPVCAYINYAGLLDSDNIERDTPVTNRYITTNNPGNTVCTTVPAKAATWGQIKNQYR